MSVRPCRATARVFACLGLVITAHAAADSTPQALPFSQDWSDTGLITTNDDWSGVPGVLGFLGGSLTSATGVDPQTVLDADATGVIDVIANLAPTATNGGVGELTSADPVVALQGSGTADAPYILLHLNTLGQQAIQVAYNVRDMDASADDAIQQVALQYRVGSSGDFTNVPAAYVADGTTTATATQLTAVSASLPAAADNIAELQLRIITTNAAGSDEWVGIDDISVTGTPSGGPTLAISDASLVEGDSGTSLMAFTVTFTGSVPGGFSVQYATSDDTAAAGSDYLANSGSIVFDGVDESRALEITINGDLDVEDDETFTITLSNPTDVGITIVDGTGTGTILNDDIAVAELFAIQGAGGASPFVGTTVRTESNVVTGVSSAGFTMQTPDARADANPLTSNGIYVFTGGAPSCDDGGMPRPVAVGDLVDVEGPVVEYFEFTEFSGGSQVIACTGSGQAMPTAVVFEIGGPGGDIPSRDPLVPYCGEIDAEMNNFECLEGMLVSIPDGIVTKGNQRFGGDPYGPVHIGPHGVRSLREPGVRFGNTIDAGLNDNAGIWDGNPEILEMDANMLGAAPSTTELVGGARFSATAVVAFSFGDYELWPTQLVTDQASNVLPRPVRARNDDAELSIGSFNVLRL